MTDLKALSDAATQGEWVFSRKKDDLETEIGIGEFGPDHFPDDTGQWYFSEWQIATCFEVDGPETSDANAALVCALVNAYRAGTLVPASEVEARVQAAVLAEREGLIAIANYHAGRNSTASEALRDMLNAARSKP